MAGEEIGDMLIIADDMGSIGIDADNRLVGYGAEMGAGVTAVMAPKFYAYVRANQLIGLLGGMKGAAEYEHLVGVEGAATSGMGAQSLVHMTIIGLIVIGNFAYFAGRRKK